MHVLTRIAKVQGMPTKLFSGFFSGWETLILLLTILCYCYMFYNGHVAMKKDTSEYKYSSCHLLSMEYTPGTMLVPLHTPSHFFPIALEGATIITPHIGKLRLQEDVQLVSGRAGI